MNIKPLSSFYKPRYEFINFIFNKTKLEPTNTCFEAHTQSFICPVGKNNILNNDVHMLCWKHRPVCMIGFICLFISINGHSFSAKLLKKKNNLWKNKNTLLD